MENGRLSKWLHKILAAKIRAVICDILIATKNRTLLYHTPPGVCARKKEVANV